MRNPFIAGSWVRGDNFFGRSGILHEILEGERHSLWVVGARRLGKPQLQALQVSPRGGELHCEDRGDRVKIAGRAVQYLQGTIEV